MGAQFLELSSFFFSEDTTTLSWTLLILLPPRWMQSLWALQGGEKEGLGFILLDKMSYFSKPKLCGGWGGK